MAQNIAECGTCGETNFCNWYGKDAPKDSYGRIDRDYMDSNPVAYCSEECRDKADAVSATPEAVARPTQYTVNCLAEDGIDSHVFAITVEYRGRDLWAVKRHGENLGADGTWDYESTPSNREDEWLATHRFDLDTALRLAKEAAPRVTVNGFTVADALRMQAKRST
jgi:hypothetical protein